MLGFILTMALTLLQGFIKNPKSIAGEWTILGEIRHYINMIIGPEIATRGALPAPFKLSKATEKRVAEVRKEMAG